MQMRERQALQRLFERVKELERDVAELKTKKRPGRPKKVSSDG